MPTVLKLPIAYDAHCPLPIAHCPLAIWRFAHFAHGLLTSAPCMQVNANVGAHSPVCERERDREMRRDSKRQRREPQPSLICALGNLRQGGSKFQQRWNIKIAAESLKGKRYIERGSCRKSKRKLSQINCKSLFTLI